LFYYKNCGDGISNNSDYICNRMQNPKIKNKWWYVLLDCPLSLGKAVVTSWALFLSPVCSQTCAASGLCLYIKCSWHWPWRRRFLKWFLIQHWHGWTPGKNVTHLVALATDPEVRGPFSLVSTIEELLVRKRSGSGLENREYGRRDPSHWPRGTLYPQKLELTSLTSGSVGVVRSRAQAMEFSLFKKLRTRDASYNTWCLRICVNIN
jgi:hypothetical protein